METRYFIFVYSVIVDKHIWLGTLATREAANELAKICDASDKAIILNENDLSDLIKCEKVHMAADYARD